jgi:6-phosphogluconolactonase
MSGMSIRVRTFDSMTSLRHAFHDDLTANLNSSLRDPYGIIISGGGTPLPVYRQLANEAPACNPQCRIVFADDRHVQRTSSDSNYGNAMPMFDALGLDASSVIGVDPELDLDAAGRDFDRRLDDLLAAEISIPIAYLGLGADGHTCSLFTQRDAAREDVFGFHVTAHAGFDRVTISRRVLMCAQRLVFLVAGEEKAPALNALLHAPSTIPAGIAVAGHPSVEVWTDLP